MFKTGFLSVGVSYFKFGQCQITKLTLDRRRHVLIKNILRCYSVSDGVVKSPYSDIKIPECTIPEYVWENMETWAEKPAMECGITGSFYSFSQVRRMSLNLAASLLEMGLKQGQVVNIILPNCIEFSVVLLGTLEAGLTVSTINPLYKEGEISHQLNDSQSSCIITHRTILPTVLSAQAKLNRQVPIICISDEQEGVHPYGVTPFSELVEGNIESSYLLSSIERRNPDDVALLPYSSGFSGPPKGVCLSSKNFLVTLEQYNHPEISHFHKTNKDHQDTIPGYVPFFHLFGLKIMLHCLRNGIKNVILPHFESQKFLNILKNNKDVIIYAVPPVILFLGTHPSVRLEHLENIRSIHVGAAPCTAAEIEKVLKRKRFPVIQAYGMTEASPLLTIPPLSCTDLSTVGPPAPNTQGKVVDLNDGTASLGPNEIGELCFRGPQMMKGYHNNPEATAQTIDSEGWLRTGDIGYYSKNGYFYIVGRKKELIKVNGHQISPTELESLLKMHPGVGDAGIVAIPSHGNGEMPVAVIVPKEGSGLNTPQVMDYLAQKVPPYKRPELVLFTDHIPKRLSGKILRPQLKEIARKLLLNGSEK